MFQSSYPASYQSVRAVARPVVSDRRTAIEIGDGARES
jgi:hypothetical protein